MKKHSGYEGAKEMLLVDEVDNQEFLADLFHSMYEELPTPKQKRRNKNFLFLELEKLEI